MTQRMAASPLLRLLVGFNLLLFVVQLWLFAPLVGSGRSVDVALFPGWLPYRLDALNLAFGAAWTLALGFGLPFLSGENRELDGGSAALLCLFSAGLLDMAYAREPLLFVVGWEVAGWSLWLFLRLREHAGRIDAAAVAMHLPGLLMLVALLIAPLDPFAPPQGGSAAAWSLPVSFLLGAVVFIRAGAAFFVSRRSSSASGKPLVSLYILAEPLLLAKALVAAPWDDFGAWALALMGTAALIGVLYACVWGVDRLIVPASACAAIGTVGLALAPVSPLAAVGAVALLLAGALWTLLAFASYRGAILFAGALPAIWLISQGALDIRYRLVGAVLLPLMLFVAHSLESTGKEPDGVNSLARTRLPVFAAALLLVVVAVYPQAAVEWVLRPVVGAMAGGVSVPSLLQAEWGVGLLVRSPQESVLAALPATGIALAVFLAWAALYWLRGLALPVIRNRQPATGLTAQSSTANPEAE